MARAAQPAAWVEVPFEVQKSHGGLRVDQHLARRLERYSRAEIQRLIAAGRVSIAQRPVKAARRVASGERVVIRYPKRQEPPCAHESLPVLFEDDILLAVNKPGDLLTHPTDKIVDNAATSILKRQFPGRTLRLLHRLDRETSGVLLLAKDAATARRLSGLFLTREVRKEYWALVRGAVGWKSTVVDAPIGREGLEIKVRQKVGTGQKAVTEFECLAAGAETSLILAKPRTGRLHQIRAHLAHIGHPILGDKLYTGEGEIYMKAVRGEIRPEDLAGLGSDRQLLHARTVTLAGRTIVAPPPEDFSAALRAHGLTAP